MALSLINQGVQGRVGIPWLTCCRHAQGISHMFCMGILGVYAGFWSKNDQLGFRRINKG